MDLATAGKDTQIRVYGLYPGTVTGFDNPKNTIKTHGREINPGPSKHSPPLNHNTLFSYL